MKPRDRSPTIPSTRKPEKRRMWRRFALIVSVLFAAVVIPPLGCYMLRRWQAATELDAAVAELDRRDPDWRWEGLQRQRAAIAVPNNAARAVLVAAGLLPRRKTDRGFYERISKLPPNVRLAGKQAKRLEEELEPLQPAIAKAKALTRLDTGRFELSWSDFDTGFPRHLDAVVRVASVLRYAAIMQIERGDFDGALETTVAMLHAGSAVGDEPCLKSQWVRMGIRMLVVQTLERIFGQDRQGEASAEKLAMIRDALWRESQQKILVAGLRGERYRLYVLGQRLAAGEEELPGEADDYWSRFVQYYSQPMVLHSTAWMLRAYTRWIEIVDLPADQRWRRLRRVEAETVRLLAKDSSLLLAKILVPRSLRAAEDGIRSIAHLRLAIVGIACERYRRQNGDWPEGLNDLPAASLPLGATGDPFTGKSVRLRRDGPSLHLLAGRKPIEGEPETARIRFRLWAVEHRRKRP